MKRVFCISALAALLLGGCGENPTPTTAHGTIAFQSSRDGNFEIYLMDADGAHQRRITQNPANDVTPALSPNGKTILFASDRSGNWEIYSMDADGSHLQQLTHGEGTNTAPSWTADGAKILFVSTRDAINGEIYRANADGGGVERLTQDVLVKDTPVMASDGTLLVTFNTGVRYGIGLYQPGSKKGETITPAKSDSREPNISPDGSHVLFASNRDGNYEIYIMNIDGTDQTRLTVNDRQDLTPAYAGDGKRFLFSRDGGIYFRPVAENKEIMLSFKGDSAPQWHEE